MNKNTTIGLILMALLIFGYGWYVQPSEEQIAMQRQQDSIANAIKQQAEKEQKMAEANRKAKAAERAKNDTTALFYSALNGKSQQVVLKNSSVELTLDTKGGVVKKARILGFKDRNGDKDVTLFDGNEQSLNFMLAGKTTNIITQDLYFTPSNVTDSTVTMTADAGNGGAIILDYKLGKDYMLRMSVQAKGLSGLFAPNYKEMDIEWSDKCRQQEKGFTFENRYATLTYKEKDGGTDYLSETSAKEDEKIEEKLDWVAFKNQFFSAVLISKDDFAANSLLTSIPQEKGTGYLKLYNAKPGPSPPSSRCLSGPTTSGCCKAWRKRAHRAKTSTCRGWSTSDGRSSASSTGGLRSTSSTGSQALGSTWALCSYSSRCC